MNTHYDTTKGKAGPEHDMKACGNSGSKLPIIGGEKNEKKVVCTPSGESKPNSTIFSISEPFIKARLRAFTLTSVQ